MNQLHFSDDKISLRALQSATFADDGATCVLDARTKENIQKSHLQLLKLIETKVPIYGVTTGFGDSSRRAVDPMQAEPLQANLIAYLLCGTGPHFSKEVSRAVMICRLRSISRGLSGVSVELIERLQMFIERDWVPMIPQEGSLGASGDLIPLAYVAQALQGEGRLFWPQAADRSTDGSRPTAEVLREAGVAPYVLKAKEGLALVNGTSVMAGLTAVNLANCRVLVDLAVMASSWACMAQNARVDAFSDLINATAKKFRGQGAIAKQITAYLTQENYQGFTARAGEPIQSRYSLRCAPQILGPILETLELSEEWLEDEINGVSDNPVIDPTGATAMGGNFYGGYIVHSMDYMKICLAHIADMLDRQMTVLIDEKANNGLPPNLADWEAIAPEQRNIHHGLKALHQSVGAITSEVMAKAIPNGIFSRSAESHNQDKVSLGLSAGVQCSAMVETLFTITSLYLITLAQGLDLRGVSLKGKESRRLYDLIRLHVPRVKYDQPLEAGVRGLCADLKQQVKLHVKNASIWA